MTYRTKTYIAGDWTGDKNLIDQLYAWNSNNWLTLSFHNAHEMSQARDTSLPCSIKKSLHNRLEASKTFVLIVGEKTDSLTKGGCRYCQNYNSFYGVCNRGMYVDHRSFIDYECEKAVKDNMKIVILYNSVVMNKNKCPDSVYYSGIHIPAIIRDNDGTYRWNYPAIRDALME